MMFDDDEAVYVKAILVQLLTTSGKAYDFSKRKPHPPTDEETRAMIEDVLNSIGDADATDEVLQRGVNFLDMLFRLSFRRTVQYCHELVDAYQLNLEPYLYTYQIEFTERLEKMLLREIVRSSTEAAIYFSELGEAILMAKEIAGNDYESGCMYGEPGDPIRREYEQRDAEALEFLRAEPEFRAYVERKVGCDIETLFK